MLQLVDLTKYYGSHCVLDRVCWEARKGEIVALLGPNGAGKSTCMKCITGFLRIDGGDVRVDGHSILTEKAWIQEKIGYLPETVPLYPEMSVRAFLTWAAGMRGLRGQDAGKSVARAVAMCALEEVLRQPIGTLSKGFRHRVCFAQALIHDPPLLLLDEPTDGLDPIQKESMRRTIREMGQDHAIVISTHLLDEVKAICSRVVVLNEGRVCFQGSIEALMQVSARSGMIHLKIAGRKGKDIVEAFYSLPIVETVDMVTEKGEHMHLLIRATGEDALEDIANFCHHFNWKILELYRDEGDLNDAFHRLILGDSFPSEPTTEELVCEVD
ncbi:MAG: ABC transporter ATP-binding protein [Lentisphaerae bacterium]|nr:MAG: ABC transporter ATP-binding protein [Lentisphaerota bacterium]